MRSEAGVRSRKAGGEPGEARRGGVDSPGVMSGRETPLGKRYEDTQRSMRTQRYEDTQRSMRTQRYEDTHRSMRTHKKLEASDRETPLGKRKHSSSGGDEDVELASPLRLLELIRNETLRIICADFSLQISGSKNVLVARVVEMHREMEQVGAAGRRCKGWLDNDSLKLTTLERICLELGLYRRGTKDELRLRIFEHQQLLPGADSAGVASSGSVGSSEHACSPLPSLRGLQSSEEEELLSGAYSYSNLENLERLSLEALSRETLRSVCFDLEVPFSGPKHVLIPRIMLKCNASRVASCPAAGAGQGAAGSGGEGEDVSGWWLFKDSVKQATLQEACGDLRVGRHGSKPLLRRRILANTAFLSSDAVLQRMLERTSATASLLPDQEHSAHESEDGLGDDDQHMPSVFDNLDKLDTCGGNCKGDLTGLRGGTRRYSTGRRVEEAMRGESKGAGGAVASLWEDVQCQRCGGTDRENKMILCDECDGGYHYDTCAYPRLEAIPRGAWYCFDCQKNRKKREWLESVANGCVPHALGVSTESVVGVAKTGRERKGIQRFRPRLGV